MTSTSYLSCLCSKHVFVATLWHSTTLRNRQAPEAVCKLTDKLHQPHRDADPMGLYGLFHKVAAATPHMCKLLQDATSEKERWLLGWDKDRWHVVFHTQKRRAVALAEM